MVQKTIEIMSFGATPMIAPAAPVNTVPRKRRPRAAGEVFITSHSNVYFVDPKAVSLAAETKIIEESDPIYQNTVTDEKLIGNQTNQRGSLNYVKNESKKVQKRHSFCSVRVSTCTSDTKIETQQVSAFIGKILNELDSFRSDHLMSCLESRSVLTVKFEFFF